MGENRRVKKTGEAGGLAALVLGSVLVGCGKGGAEPQAVIKTAPPKVASTAPSKKPVAKKPVSDRPANHKGMTLVGEWHHIGIGKTTMHRSPTEFRGDLERLDKLGFRPVTAKDWLAGNMDLAKGASPVVMTFDDANPDQFQLLEDGTVDPKCGVGIWLDYAKAHPDFPVRATFFVLPTMWGQPKMVEKKLQMLSEWGCEVANHTITHVPLRRQTDDRVKQEIGDAALALAKLGEKGPYNLAYPLGSTPKNIALLKGFPYKAGTITVASGFLVGANPSATPPKDLYHIPRIQATKGDYGLDYWLDKVAQGKVKVYVE